MSVQTCPDCNGKAIRIYDSRASKGNRCRRRYKCACGHRFTTIEEICDDDKITNQVLGKNRQSMARLISKQQKLIEQFMQKLRSE